jgi:adiponectin receptor
VQVRCNKKVEKVRLLCVRHFLKVMGEAVTLFTVLLYGISLAIAYRFWLWLSRQGEGKPRRLLSLAEVQPHLRGNPWITHGYRDQLTLYECWRSLFALHNETLNIWSHLLGTVYFLVLAWREAYDLATNMDGTEVYHRISVLMFTLAASQLCFFSTVFHAVGCRSEQLYVLTAKLDYSGISLMILFSFPPVMLNFFACHHLPIAFFYISSIGLLTVVALVMSWSPRFSAPTPFWTRIRAGVFITIGLFGVIPVFHAGVLHKDVLHVIWPFLLMAVLYIAGAVIYALHFPECLFRAGHCNTGPCTSHLIFHISALLAATVHYWGIEKLFQWRLAQAWC